MKRILEGFSVARVGIKERMGLKVYDIPGLDKRFLEMKKSFDHVNKMVNGMPGQRQKNKQ